MPPFQLFPLKAVLFHQLLLLVPDLVDALAHPCARDISTSMCVMNASAGQEVQWRIAIFLSILEPDYTSGEDLGRLGRAFLL
jgi:hypothetical protein